MGRGEFLECRPRLLARPNETSVDALPAGISLAVRKRTIKMEYVRMIEYVRYKEAYVPAAQDGMQQFTLAAPVAKADYCINGNTFLECLELFSECMVTMFPFDPLMRDELKEYGRFIGSKFNDLPFDVVGRIDDHARAFCYKHRCAFWPISPQVLAEITMMVASCLVVPLPHLPTSRAFKATRERNERKEPKKEPKTLSFPCHDYNYGHCSRHGASHGASKCKYGHFCAGCGGKAIHPVSGCKQPQSVALMVARKTQEQNKILRS